MNLVTDETPRGFAPHFWLQRLIPMARSFAEMHTASLDLFWEVSYVHYDSRQWKEADYIYRADFEFCWDNAEYDARYHGSHRFLFTLVPLILFEELGSPTTDAHFVHDVVVQFGSRVTPKRYERSELAEMTDDILCGMPVAPRDLSGFFSVVHSPSGGTYSAAINRDQQWFDKQPPSTERATDLTVVETHQFQNPDEYIEVRKAAKTRAVLLQEGVIAVGQDVPNATLAKMATALVS